MMATPTASSITISCLFCVSLFLLLCSSKNGYALGDGERKTMQSHFHTFQVNSLLPASVCSPSIKDKRKGRTVSLKVVHKYGPCSHPRPEKASAPPTLTEILTRDQSRVNSIQSRLRQNSLEKDSSSNSKATTTIPAKSGISVGSPNYIVTVGLGTPKKQLSLVFDTGSAFVWTQCKPCTVFCYKQKQPIFDPSHSSTYKNITCTSRQCSQLSSSTSTTPSCSTNTCVYGMGYGDGSTSYGFFASETLTLTPSDVFPHFLFGCGENNQGKFDGEAGLIGLGRSRLSLVSQISSKYGNYFSYCLPSTPSYTGSLKFGKGGRSSAGSSLQFTPLLSKSKDPSSYYVDIIGIKVGGKTLSISQSVFKTPGSIIDSGTVITRLPPAAYDALKTAFRRHMTQYRMGKPVSGFDTCYRVKKNTTLKIPSISFVFGGNIEVAIDYSGILLADSSNACLAFLGNSNSSDLLIFGNAQQKTLDVVYDVAGGKLGFGHRGCS
ncbi:Aspartyl protease family protein [Camellia lanceoleosa]|uniref:Aspartyl protease family protein n=1 Tax=Camellia lanceoleosa TaxID=1840588 RepID=A0ACC0FI65_9ERIC|nr:Aspartyl protease family protein [Camellia lanceoleosa]